MRDVQWTESFDSRVDLWTCSCSWAEYIRFIRMLKTTTTATVETALTPGTAPPGSLSVSRWAKLALHYRQCMESRFCQLVLKNNHRDFCDFKIGHRSCCRNNIKMYRDGRDRGGNSGGEIGGDARDANRFYLFWLVTWWMRSGLALGRRVEQHSTMVDGVTEIARETLKFMCLEPIEKKNVRTGSHRALKRRVSSCKLNYKQ